MRGRAINQSDKKRETSSEEESGGPRKQLSIFLRRVLLSPLPALRLPFGKRLIIVIISYGLAVPGFWFLFPLVHNGATLLLPIISAGFLFRYRGLLITLMLNVVIICLLYFFLRPDIVTVQVFVVRLVLGSTISLVLGLVVCGLRTVVDLRDTARMRALAGPPE